MNDLCRCKRVFATLSWVAAAFIVSLLALFLVSGCATLSATLYEPAVDYALKQVEQNLTDKVDGLVHEMTNKVEELVHEVATKPIPALPPAGSTWTEYGVWAGTVAMGSLAVLVDRRKFHRKNATRPSESNVGTR